MDHPFEQGQCVFSRLQDLLSSVPALGKVHVLPWTPGRAGKSKGEKLGLLFRDLLVDPSLSSPVAQIHTIQQEIYWLADLMPRRREQ